ncbi:MAG: RICIN domain-containing protein, partial [Frankia sp.]
DLSASVPGPVPGRPDSPKDTTGSGSAHGHRWRRLSVIVAVVVVVLTVGATALKLTVENGSDPDPHQELAANYPGSVRPSTAAVPLVTATSSVAARASTTAQAGSPAAGLGAGDAPAGGAAPAARPVAAGPRPSAVGSGSPAPGNPASGNPAPAPAAPPVQAASKTWVDTATGACLDSDGSRVYTLGCNGGDYQQWTRDGLRLRNGHWGNCLTSKAGGYNAEGVQYPDGLYMIACDGTSSQQWVVASSTRFGQAFRNVGTGKCLDSNQQSPEGKGYQAYMLPCNGGNYQNWT